MQSKTGEQQANGLAQYIDEPEPIDFNYQKLLDY